MTLEVLDPTWGDGAAPFAPAAPLGSLQGAVVGVVSNGKQGTRAFFDALAAELRETHGVAEVPILVKDNYSAPAATEIMDEASSWNALVSGIGD